MASHGKLHQAFLVIFLVTCSIASSHVEGRESMFFSKVNNPVRRYSQLVSSSMPALAPLPSSVATPAPAPASEVEPASENYIFGFYNREVGEFPVATTKTEAYAARKTSGGDNFMNNNARFGSRDERHHQHSKFNNYNDEYTSSNREVDQYPDFQRSYRSNNNVHKYTRSYDHNNNMYTTNYNTEDDNNDQYTTENRYYTNNFERVKPRKIGRRFIDNRRYYNDNGDGYYRDNESANQYNPVEEYEGVYQP